MHKEAGLNVRIAEGKVLLTTVAVTVENPDELTETSVIMSPTATRQLIDSLTRALPLAVLQGERVDRNEEPGAWLN